MIINGLTGINAAEPAVKGPERDQLVKEKVEEQKRSEKKVEKNPSDQAEKHEKQSPQYEMNEYYLKELLFLLSSRGNSATIEKLAQLLKKEKETLAGVR